MSEKTSLIKDLFAAGAQLGYSRSRHHPSTRSRVFTFQGGGAVIDLEQTIADLERAKAFIRGLALEGKNLMIVGTKDEAISAVTKVAESLGLPYVTKRWLGGTLTNWTQIKSRIERLKKLKEEREQGGWDRFTKKERLLLGREIDRLERYLSTMSGLTEVPAALVLVDPDEETVAVVEAAQMGIPVVALANSDCNLAQITYPVVANDANVRTIALFLAEVEKAYNEGRAARPAVVEEPVASAAK